MFQVTTTLPGSKEKADKIGTTKEGLVDYDKDFFKKPAFLTVSGQLAVENYACALSDVYTFGPTFRAENSHTSRHLSEFWMIEPEMCFADIYDDMECGESYLKYCLKYVLENNKEDLEFLNSFIEKGLIDRLKNVVENDFVKLSYTECIEILKEAVSKDKKLFADEKKKKEKKKKEDKKEEGEKVEKSEEQKKKELEEREIQKKLEEEKKDEKRKIYWGMDMSSEHERYITEVLYKKPVIVYNYPAEIKSFYMRINEDNKTVAAMDILVPKIGEIIGGSQREERLDVLTEKIKAKGLDPASYWWYCELRKYGSVPHSGFGLGFERLVMMATGMENIRDVIPFPRFPDHADF
jgi:asparaginyl-tRNA synthetase